VDAAAADRGDVVFCNKLTPADAAAADRDDVVFCNGSDVLLSIMAFGAAYHEQLW